jgi:hypothetical protein
VRSWSGSATTSDGQGLFPSHADRCLEGVSLENSSSALLGTAWLVPGMVLRHAVSKEREVRYDSNERRRTRPILDCRGRIVTVVVGSGDFEAFSPSHQVRCKLLDSPLQTSLEDSWPS